jgi:hypothetical protein
LIVSDGGLILLIQLLPLGILSGKANCRRRKGEEQHANPESDAHIPLRVSGVLKS